MNKTLLKITSLEKSFEHRNGKIELFNNRIAPIQINYLGFPGTTGLPNIDFLIADKFVIPK